MNVIATAKGYYDALREIGDVFEVPDGTTGTWFEVNAVADADAPKPKGRGKAAKADDEEMI